MSSVCGPVYEATADAVGRSHSFAVDDCVVTMTKPGLFLADTPASSSAFFNKEAGSKCGLYEICPGTQAEKEGLPSSTTICFGCRRETSHLECQLRCLQWWPGTVFQTAGRKLSLPPPCEVMGVQPRNSVWS